MSLRNRPTLVSFVALLVSGTVAAVLLGYGALVLAGAFLSGTLVAALTELAFPLLPLFILSVVVAVLSTVGVVYGLAKRVTVLRGGRIESVARRAEAAVPLLRRLGVADAVAEPEPTPEERRQNAIESLKRRYIDDEISDAEFERRLDRLVSSDAATHTDATRTDTAAYTDADATAARTARERVAAEDERR